MSSSTTLRRDASGASALWRNRDSEAARAALVREFMPLARSLARRYERSSEPLDDLVQVAALGLVKAIDRFDPDRGVAFASFAVPTILGELRRYFRDCCWDVHVPRRTQENVLAIENAQRRITVESGRAPSVSELAQYLELDAEQVLDAMRAANAYGAMSLDAPRSTNAEDDQLSYADSLGDIDDGYELVEASATVAGALAHISERERTVLALRFGEDLTQSEIAQRIGVSQMQVSRLLRHALEHLRILTRAQDGDEP
ncbi:MAG: SigB/SigF/SigG family RNA polymerase sigma factor [Solirubrobacteraceae bacterium]